MMNQARINVAVSATTLAGTAYHHAVAYARERVQGSNLAGRKDGYVPIIDHPDVRRMLLWMKAASEGMRSMIYSGAFWSDLAHELPLGEERTHYEALLDFITPILKAYCSDLGFRVCETAVQVLGGYGFTKDYPLELYLRDAKIMSLYEGTNGIQSMDLMGRKMKINDGAPFKAFMAEVEGFCRRQADHPVIGGEARRLAEVSARLSETALELARLRDSDPLRWGASSYPALLCFGDVTLAWRLLDMAATAHRLMDGGKSGDFYNGKILQATYFSGTDPSPDAGPSRDLPAGGPGGGGHTGRRLLRRIFAAPAGGSAAGRGRSGRQLETRQSIILRRQWHGRQRTSGGGDRRRPGHRARRGFDPGRGRSGRGDFVPQAASDRPGHQGRDRGPGPSGRGLRMRRLGPGAGRGGFSPKSKSGSAGSTSWSTTPVWPVGATTSTTPRPQEWDKVMKTNIYGPYHCARAALPFMRAQNQGWIVNVSSAITQNYMPTGGPYGVAKAGIEAPDPDTGLGGDAPQHPRQLHRTGPGRKPKWAAS